jgi:uncharacterized cupredoxin-like copper-binding protein
VHTIEPTTGDTNGGRDDRGDVATVAERPPTGTPPTPPARPAPDPLGAGGFAIVIAVLALVFASVGVVFARDGGGDGGAPEAAAVAVSLTEFALTPAAVTVPEGGRLVVTNDGTTAHNLAISGTDLVTADLAAGESQTLDLSSLAAGDYEVICEISGHADSGMTGTLTVGGEASVQGGMGTDHDMASMGGSEGGAGGTAGDAMTEEQYAEMDRAMEESIASYPVATEGTGNQVLEPEVAADGTKVFRLTAEVTPWEVEPGTTVDAWTYNGTVPGPQIKVDVGDRVRIELANELPMATDLHLHGINVANQMDGVSPLTQPAIEPGESFTYEFTADEVAVAMYHAHHHGQLQVPNGLLGTLVVGDEPLPTGQTISGYDIPADLRVSQELPLVLNDSGVIGFSLNGKSFPATEPIVGDEGDWILVHYFNEGAQIHPMHLHQFDQLVVAKDGYPLDHPYMADTVNVAPGERYSVLVHLDRAGTWVWHCHILGHVERDTGMYGMVTAVVVS